MSRSSVTDFTTLVKCRWHSHVGVRSWPEKVHHNFIGLGCFSDESVFWINSFFWEIMWRFWWDQTGSLYRSGNFVQIWDGTDLGWDRSEMEQIWDGTDLGWDRSEMGQIWDGTDLRWNRSEMGQIWDGTDREIEQIWDETDLRWDRSEMEQIWDGTDSSGLVVSAVNFVYYWFLDILYGIC